MELTQKQINQKRYDLHRKIRKQGFKLVTRKRTIYTYSFKNITKDVKKLKKKYHYAIQLEIK